MTFPSTGSDAPTDSVKNPISGFLDHVEELRRRILISLAVIVAGSIPCGIFWKTIYNVVILFPLKFIDPQPHLIYTSPAGTVMLSFQIAVVGGIVLASPIIFFQLWGFVAPALYKKEKSIVLPLAFFTFISFGAGVAFSYVVLPLFLKFLITFGSGTLEPYFKINEYAGFLFKIVLAFGIIFELPVASFVLTRAGLITSKLLIKHIRHSIVVIFILAAILTPPDVVSQIIMAVPLLALYGISILVSFFTGRRMAS